MKIASRLNREDHEKGELALKPEDTIKTKRIYFKGRVWQNKTRNKPKKGIQNNRESSRSD